MLAGGLDLGDRNLRATPVAGGDVNQAYALATEDGKVFVKLNAPERLPMFEAEARALSALAAADAIRVPRVLATGIASGRSYLALEWLSLTGLDAQSRQRLGRGLAALHAVCDGEYGWPEDNWIGTTPQCNGRVQSWVEFFITRRLQPQCALLDERSGGADWCGRLQRAEPEIRARLTDCGASPALLHGDLWSGNASALGQGAPVIYDPASYYGDSETDLAMTELFGGFGEEFYAAYDEMRPRRSDYGARTDVYQLYHILNHANLFGAHYQSRAATMMSELKVGRR